MDEFLKKITVANFVRYIGPGIVLFGLVKFSKVKLFETLLAMFVIDKKAESTFLLLTFLLIGVLVHTTYRALFYNKLFLFIKDFIIGKLISWKNYRSVLISKYEVLKEKNLLVRYYHAQWVWRLLRLKFFKSGCDEYDQGMELWASSIHLLYFTSISAFILFILEMRWGCCMQCVLYLFVWIITFLGGLIADIEYERYETSFYEDSEKVKKVEEYLEKIFKYQSFIM